ncbi:DMT family transporter [bacterium]|nr:MAG: DMT family transporter [bacterium]
MSRASYGVLTKVLSNQTHIDPMTQTFYLMVASICWGILLSPFIGGLHLVIPPSAWMPLTVAILTSTLGNIWYFKGIKSLQSASTQVIFSSIVIWNALLAWLILGSRLGTSQILGVLLLLIAILLAQYQGKRLHINRGAWYILASAVAFAGFQITSAALSRQIATADYLVITYAGNALLIGIYFARTIWSDMSHRSRRTSDLLKTAVITGAASILYNLFAFIAYAHAPDPGIVVLLLTTQVIAGVMLSIIFLHEHDHLKTKLGAASLAVIAAMLIKS